VPCLPTAHAVNGGVRTKEDVIKSVDTALLLRLISMCLYAPSEAGPSKRPASLLAGARASACWQASDRRALRLESVTRSRWVRI
jgi:hypothetical protein